MSGFIVNKPQPQSFYNASKAAVHHLTKSLAAEWGQRGVRVNAVAPTYIETPLTSFGIKENPEMYKTWLGDDADGPHRPARRDRLGRACSSPPMRASLMTGSDRGGRRRLYLLVGAYSYILARREWLSKDHRETYMSARRIRPMPRMVTPQTMERTMYTPAA